MFDDLPKPKTDNQFPRDLENMSVSELEEYILELQAEIERTRGDIEAKKASQNAANSVFK